MRITKRTKTKDVLCLLNEERLDYILANIPKYPLKKSVFAMTVGEFLSAQEDEYMLNILKVRKAFKAFGMLRTFKEEMAMVNKLIGANQIPESAEIQQSKMGVQFPSPNEAILLELTEFFHLDDIEKAGKIPVAQWLMVHRKQSAEQKMQYNLQKITEQKNKLKKR